MKRIITTLFIAVILSATGLSAQNIIPTFVIDGQKVENFDGSQLAGKTIVSYTVKNNTHFVVTADFKESTDNGEKIVGYGTLKITEAKKHAEDEVMVGGVNKDEIVYVVDGKEVSYEQFKTITTPNIKSISVVRSKDNPEFKKYAKADTKGVLILQTR